MKAKNHFEIDWRFGAEDLIWNAEQLIGKLPIKFIRNDMSYGDDIEVVEAEGKEINFKIDDTDDRLLGIIDLINKYIPDKRFEQYATDGDSYGFKLVDFPYKKPSKSKYFIIYFITSSDPTTGKTVGLTLGNNKYYASKVEGGQSLMEKIDSEIPILTGSDKYHLTEVKENYDFGLDKEGKRLRRDGLFIEIPYFDIKSRNLKFKMEWEEMEII